MVSRLGAVLIVGLGALAVRVNGEAAPCASVLEAGKFRRGEAESVVVKRCEEDSTSSTVATTAATTDSTTTTVPTICSQACTHMFVEKANVDYLTGAFKILIFDSSGLTQTDHYCALAGSFDMEESSEGVACYFTNENDCDGAPDSNFEYCALNHYLP
jgi:hypothetical protein